MTVAELVNALLKFDPNMKVVTGGFDESGFDDIVAPEVIRIVQRNEGGFHMGMYDELDSVDEDERIWGDPFDAVHINFCEVYKG